MEGIAATAPISARVFTTRVCEYGFKQNIVRSAYGTTGIRESRYCQVVAITIFIFFGQRYAVE